MTEAGPVGSGAWRLLRWVAPIAFLGVVAMALLASPIRRVDTPLPPLPVRLLDGGAPDDAWRAGRPLVIHVWLPG